jgi:hypothetical protein
VTVVVTGGGDAIVFTILRGLVRSRFAAWWVTGPLGHLVAGVADWCELLARYAWARARGRLPRS